MKSVRSRIVYQPRERSLAPLIATGLVGAAALAILRRVKPREPLRDKSVLITGGSRGLGFVLAREALGRGARVAICGRDPESLERARLALDRPGAEIMALACDVTDAATVQGVVDAVARRLGPVDVLINNAGVIQVGPAEEMASADYAEALAVNFKGTLNATQAVLPEMRARRRGWIVNIASIGGKISVPHLLPYSASKFATVGFSRGLRTELAPHGITVVTVCPGLMRTGSPRNATFRGRHRLEFAWFNLADSLPFVSMSAESAARRILDAAMRGDAEVIFPAVLRAAVIADAIAPDVMSGILTFAARLLPGEPRVATGRKPGKDSGSLLSPSWLSTLGDQAAREYNQMAPGET